MKKSKRRCGRCSACCTSLGVPELSKDIGERCKRVGRRGCSRYDERPASCRGFECLWLQGAFASNDRPDRIGIVFDIQDGVHGEQIVKAYRDFESNRGRERLCELEAKVVVYVIEPDSRRVIGPPDKVAAFFHAAGLGGASREMIEDPVAAQAFADEGRDEG